MSLILATEELLKRTTSRCPVCLTACPAEVWKFGTSPAKVYLRRNCPEHGTHSSCISSDARFYWLSQGSDANACCGPGQACRTEDGEATGVLGRNAYLNKSTPFEKLSTCLALIELVESYQSLDDLSLLARRIKDAHADWKQVGPLRLHGGVDGAYVH